MKAVVYIGPGDVIVTEVNTPTPGVGEVLLRVLSNTICGTDLRIAKGIKKKGVLAPRVLGHEVAGEVVQLGQEVEDFQIGDKVGMSPTYACGACADCKKYRSNLCKKAQVLGHQADGGLAEFLLVPAKPVRDGVLVKYQKDHDPVAISLAEPLSCIIHGQKFLNISDSDVVLIIGGGAIGLMHAKLAKSAGASKVILSEPVAFRRALALEFGADLAVDPTNEDLAQIIQEQSDSEGASVVIVCIGIPGLVNQALALAANRGRVSLFAGFPPDESASIDSNLIHYKEISVFGSSNSTIEDYEQAIQMIELGEIDTAKLVTHRFNLDQYEEAVEMISNPNALKIAIIPNQAS
jgi:L-iditol 2-dehydrogenase